MIRYGVDLHSFVLRYKLCISLLAVACSHLCSAQTASVPASFEVATIRPVSPDAHHSFPAGHSGPHVTASRASYLNMTIVHLLAYANNVQVFQVTGPPWTTTQPFDIEANLPEGASTPDDRLMLQALLRNRFQLTFHVEKKELESYVLLVGDHGSKLRLTPTIDTTPEGIPTPDKRSNNGVQTTRFDASTFTQHWELSKISMQDFAKRLSVCIDSTYHNVVDKTDLKGSYQVAYDCPVPRSQRSMAADESGSLPVGSGNENALASSLNRLGLKLEKRKLLEDVYIIDHVQEPSDN